MFLITKKKKDVIKFLKKKKYLLSDRRDFILALKFKAKFRHRTLTEEKHARRHNECAPKVYSKFKCSFEKQTRDADLSCKDKQ